MTTVLNKYDDNGYEDHENDSIASISEVEEYGLSTSRKSTSVETQEKTEKKEYIAVVTRENLVVNQAELMAFFTILYSATSLGIAVRLMTKNDEEKEFATGFQAYSRELVLLMDRRIEEALSALLFIADNMVSFAEHEGISFPNVTLPDFEYASRQALQRTILSTIRWNPVIPVDNMDAWNAYSGLIPTNRVNATHPFVPTWQYAPEDALVDFSEDANLLDKDYYKMVVDNVQKLRSPLLSSPRDFSCCLNVRPNVPTSLLVLPVYANDDHNASEIIGYLDGAIDWEELMSRNLPERLGLMTVELEDRCSDRNSFHVKGPSSVFLDHEDHIEKEHIRVNYIKVFDMGLHLDDESVETACVPTMTIYATDDFRLNYKTKESAIYTSLVLAVFFFTTFIFMLYFCLVRRRHARLENTVEQTAKIVTNIFPGAVGKRFLAEAQEKEINASFGPKAELKKVLGTSGLEKATGEPKLHEGKPIADLFSETTIIFMDIVGFTAWSSTREPSQVFSLLETIYQHFDAIAHRRKVFKIETVGDCYVAVAGLPDPRKDHAVIMARFANDCLMRFSSLTKKMESVLGPDTGDLGIRIGLHSGPVTAGVLRGERARFQLFGDTVNTTARMESTGERNRIQMSQETADILAASGKGHWCLPRQECVYAKGKGQLQTFWLDVRTSAGRSSLSNSSTEKTHSNTCHDDLNESCHSHHGKIVRENSLLADVDEKRSRLIDWNTELLLLQLKAIVAYRQAQGTHPDPPNKLRILEMENMSHSGSIFDEVEEIIRLPQFEPVKNVSPANEVTLDDEIRGQLRDYVATLSETYHDHSFHNFEHASHVTMSVHKLFSRIVAPDIPHDQEVDPDSILHDHTYGISSDPLTRFAVYLSALLHDADHPGLPNSTLCSENTPMAKVYGYKSVAEQNSIELAWNLLMGKSYEKLRQVIYTTEAEYNRFRQLVVNTVLATDIIDKTLNQARKSRWQKAFAEDSEENRSDAVNRKATIVIEHLIQASDVSHTMQHWHVYRKWNTRFFHECYMAFLNGRAEKNPADDWYQSELGFFDFYVIPLAKKLKDCGVFGVSSDEYLDYAISNRKEWERKGRQNVAELVEQVKEIKPRRMLERSQSKLNACTL